MRVYCETLSDAIRSAYRKSGDIVSCAPLRPSRPASGDPSEPLWPLSTARQPPDLLFANRSIAAPLIRSFVILMIPIHLSGLDMGILYECDKTHPLVLRCYPADYLP